MGTPSSGRIHKDIENVIGLFINTIVIKGELSPSMSFKDFLSSLSVQCVEAFEHEEYPFDELIDKVYKVRNMGRNPLFDVMFSYQKDEGVEESDNTLGLSNAFEPESTTSKFDITIECISGIDGYKISMEYRTDLFKRDTISRMMKHYEEIVRQIGEDETKRVGEYRVLTEEEKQIWTEYNDTAEDIETTTLTELVLRKCKKAPERIAVVCDENEISYGELLEKAGRTAVYLENIGVKAGSHIAISGEKCVETVVNILGILMAGCSYVPENPEYPEERNRYIRENSKCIMRLDSRTYEDEKIASCPEKCTISKPSEEAYTIYTSGSTGQPKGVVIRHSAAAAR